jgi:hypothetical protein
MSTFNDRAMSVSAERDVVIINFGTSTLVIPIHGITLVGAALMLFAFIAMPWIQLLFNFTGLDLFIDNLNSFSVYRQNGIPLPNGIEFMVYSLILIPLTALICGIRAFLHLLSKAKASKGFWLITLGLGVISLYPYFAVYTSQANSFIGRYLIQSGFWFSLIGCIVIVVSGIVGLNRKTS